MERDNLHAVRERGILSIFLWKTSGGIYGELIYGAAPMLGI